MLTIVFGTRTESTDDPLVKTALRVSREFMNCTGPMSNLTDFVNPLQWFTNPFTARPKNLHEDLVKSYGGMIKDIERRMQAGEQVQDCSAKTMLQVRELRGWTTWTWRSSRRRSLSGARRRRRQSCSGSACSFRSPLRSSDGCRRSSTGSSGGTVCR